MRTEQRHDGVLYAVAGASRHGKTSWVKQRIKDAARLLVLRDPRLEYLELGCKIIETLPALARTLRECTGRGRFIYHGPDADFEHVCRLGYLWAQQWPCILVAEEISDVTNPGKAPGGWGDLIRKGLYYGPHIYSVTQRPAECDKTVWGNASCIHTHGFVRQEDREYMARQLGVPVAEVEALRPFEYLERWAGHQAVTRGAVSLTGAVEKA